MKLSSKLLAAYACAVVSLASPLANASLINNNDGTFTDTSSGYLWRTLGQYDNLTYTQAVALLPTGFHAASETELATLTAAAPADSTRFQADASAMGLSSDYSIIWGFYGDGSGYAWREDWNDDSWSANLANTSGWYDFGGAIPANYHTMGLSLFAVDTTPVAAAVPEPASLALLGLGVAALPLTRRRAKRLTS